ncbi:metabotropic glutamate receptor-like [Antedon mediterranea]|uniref:metabotropic glutamate receptor-like n=1 Tax=Antedon mediterranea TaxID=105859 RepID=UPI003AF4CA3B
MEIVLLILSLFASVLVSSSTSSQTCSSPLVGVVDGNVRLGFLFPFFGKDGDFCSSEPIAENIALVEAAIYAVKNIPDASKIPGVSIGLEAFDSCSSHKVGGQHVLNYIDNQLYNINGSLCSDVILRPGIIGPMIDEVTQYVSPLLSYQNIPLIVYGEATSSEFTENRDIHSSFFSLAPSEKIQVQVIVDLLWNMNWNYVAVMYSETMETTFDKLLTNANDAGICLAERVRVTSQIQDTFENGIMKILRNSDIKGNGGSSFRRHVHLVVCNGSHFKCRRFCVLPPVGI